MAHAHRRGVEVPQPPKIEERVVLEMTVEEAEFLRDVFGAIGGNPEHSRRRHADALNRALIGVMPSRRILPSDRKGSISFESTKSE